MNRVAFIVTWLLLLFGCENTSKPSARHPAKVDARRASGSQSSPQKPRLVVLLVLDQLGSNTFSRYLPYLPEDGALRQLAEQGVFVERATLPYAASLTGPGHTAIQTGTTPRVNGVAANFKRSLSRDGIVSVFDDEKHRVLGEESSFASPSVIRAETLGEVLKRESQGKSKVIALSIKARAAVPSGGPAADAVFWYSAKLRGFTTSTYYAKSLPTWLRQWSKRYPVSSYLKVWKPQDPETYRELLGDDASDAEGQQFGFGNSFPHDPRETDDPYSSWTATPQSSAYLLRLARQAVVAYDLGSDDAADLLTVSVSGTDIVGHLFGPGSWEYLDNLRRVDLELGKLVRFVQARGPVAIAVTSDHGAAPVPERRATGKLAESMEDAERQAIRKGGRLVDAKLQIALEEALEKKFGEGPWLKSYMSPHVALSDKARRHEKLRELINFAKQQLLLQRGVAEVWPIGAGASQSELAALPTLVRESVPPSLDADLYIVPKQYVVSHSNGRGTSHGTPWSYDRNVPFLFSSPGVKPHRITQAKAQNRIAPTIAALLGVSPPKHSRGTPLFVTKSAN